MKYRAELHKGHARGWHAGQFAVGTKSPCIQSCELLAMEHPAESCNRPWASSCVRACNSIRNCSAYACASVRLLLSCGCAGNEKPEYDVACHIERNGDEKVAQQEVREARNEPFAEADLLVGQVPRIFSRISGAACNGSLQMSARA